MTRARIRTAHDHDLQRLQLITAALSHMATLHVYIAQVQRTGPQCPRLHAIFCTTLLSVLHIE